MLKKFFSFVLFAYSVDAEVAKQQVSFYEKMFRTESRNKNNVNWLTR